MRPVAKGKLSLKKGQAPSSILEREANDMEEKLKQLKQQMAGEKTRRDDIMNQSGSRWAAASNAKPIKNYSQKCIDQKNDYINKKGGKLGGTINIPKQQLQNTGGSKQFTSLSKTQQPNLPNRPNSGNKKPLPQYQNFRPKSRESQNSQQAQNNNNRNKSGKENILLPNQELMDNNSQVMMENNLTKHLNMQKQKEPEHIVFLKELNLMQYQERFEENGFDDLETIIELNTELLNDMMIPAGHQIKIIKKVDKIRVEKNLDPQKETILNQYSKKQQQQDQAIVPRQKQQQQQPQQQQKQVKKRTDLVELEYNEEEDLSQKQTHSIAIGDDDDLHHQNQPKVTKKSVFDGEFDEQANQKAFQDAVQEWRGGGKQESSGTQQNEEQQQNVQANKVQKDRKKSVKFDTDVVDNEGKSSAFRGPKKSALKSQQQQQQQTEKKEETKSKPGLFFMGGGETEFDNSQYHPSNADSGIQTVNESIPITEKTSCWNCFKVFPVSQQISESGKTFCTKPCYEVYQKSQTIKCSNNKCSKSVIKNEANFKNGFWYCSQKCAPSIEEICIQMRENNQNIINNTNNKEQNNDNNQNIKNIQAELDENEIANLEKPYERKARVHNLMSLKEDQNNMKDSTILTLKELEQKYSQKNVQEKLLENQSEIFQDSLDNM